ncbi:hypothetical protein ACFE04_021933 [Oxalis oulophora]
MAANLARRTLVQSTSAKSIFNRSSSSTSSTSSSFSAKLSGLGSPSTSTASRSTPQRLCFSRPPVQLGGVLSLMPLHSATASALHTNLLSLSNAKWGCLSEAQTVFLSCTTYVQIFKVLEQPYNQKHGLLFCLAHHRPGNMFCCAFRCRSIFAKIKFCIAIKFTIEPVSPFMLIRIQCFGIYFYVTSKAIPSFNIKIMENPF